MEISGKINQFLQVQSGQGKNGPWKKQEFILETGDTYPKKVCIAVWGDKIPLNNYKPGDEIVVSFDVESREYNGRWYTDVKAWKITGKQQDSNGGNMPPPPSYQEYSDMPAQDDDLPF